MAMSTRVVTGRISYNVELDRHPKEATKEVQTSSKEKVPSWILRRNNCSPKTTAPSREMTARMGHRLPAALESK